MGYDFVIKKNRDKNFEVWRVDDDGIYYSVLTASEDFMKKLSKALTEAGL